ncbi:MULTISPECIES: DUF2141 domain-containing protein [unclassified Sphingomonas]|uniref:DUF2141 domain-containing protein n=1 Tax=Novosphingobium rhizosphaerae TaxID=1551649 RepID=UPI0015CEA62B
MNNHATMTRARRMDARLISALAACGLALSLGGEAVAQAQVRTPDQGCLPGQPALTVEVSGFVNDTGTVRAQLYGPGGARFLDKGQWVMRIEQVRRAPGPMHFCFPINQPGDYAVAVRHDANGNGKSDWNDGGGFTRNPHLSLMRLKPSFTQSAVPVNGRSVNVAVVMQYRRGLSIGPITR